MKRFTLFSIILILISIQSVAQTEQEQKIQAKLDSLILMQKQLKSMQQDIYNSTVYVDPLKDKRFGIEVNPMSFFAGNFTAGLQLFDLDRTAEFSIPISYYHPIKFFDSTDDEYEFSVDLQYRKFPGEHQNGFWFGGGVRYTLANELVRDSKYINSGYGYGYYDYTSHLEKKSYFGIMTGIGYRYYTQSGFYWGCSFSAGRYFNVHESTEDYNYRTPYFYDLELLKIGFTF